MPLGWIVGLVLVSSLPGIFLARRLRRWLTRESGLSRQQRTWLWRRVAGHALWLGLLMGIILVAMMVPIQGLLDRAAEVSERLREFIGFAVTMVAFGVVMRFPWRWSNARLLRLIRRQRHGI